jgi:hypothetical protein
MAATLINDRFQMDMSVVGYEFPDRLTDADDANWLVIRLELSLVYGAWRWHVEDAGALTWELGECIQWLYALSDGRPVTSERCGFSEPDISFETIRDADGEVVGLTLYLMDEFQPPTKVLMPRENNIVSLRFHTPPDVLRQFAQALEADLHRFPVRARQPG